MKKNWIIVSLILLALVLSWYWFEKKRFPLVGSGEVRAVFLDIGQGDSTYFTFEGGKNMLVDCGKDAKVLEALGRAKQYFDREIDLLLVTHPDLDHYGGCTDVLNKFVVHAVMTNGDTKTNDPVWQYFLSRIKSEGALHTIRLATGTEQMFGVGFEWLYPNHALAADNRVPSFTKDTGSNNGSIVFRLTASDHRILMTGDAEDELEKYLLRTASSSLRADVLKVGHHGSPGSTSDLFMKAVQPKHSIISSGVENTYGHPSPRVLRRLDRFKSMIWRTDTQGDIMVTIDKNGLRVQSRK